MNVTVCQECGKHHGDECPVCGSANGRAIGDIYLRMMGVDAYLSRPDWPGRMVLIVKKPSGQVIIDLSPEDALDS